MNKVKTTKVKATAKKKVTTAKPKAKATTATKKKTTTAKPKATVTKKTTTAKPKVKATATTKKKTTTAKPAVKRAGPKFKRGYKVTLINKELVLNGVKDLYELYEVTGPKVDKTRWFVDEESVQLFIAKCEQSHIEANALAGKGHQFVKGVISETKELMAASELPELNSEVADDRYVAKNKEDNDN
jgi:hypothetical protein